MYHSCRLLSAAWLVGGHREVLPLSPRPFAPQVYGLGEWFTPCWWSDTRCHAQTLLNRALGELRCCCSSTRRWVGSRHRPRHVHNS